jgi:polygalacturonase
MAPLVSIVHGRNISVLGGGVLDANGEMWWKNHCGNWWCPKGYNISDPKAFRPFLFRTDYSTDIHLGNITMKNPGFWNFVPVHSQRILVEKVNVSAKWSSQEAAEAAPYLGLEASAPHFNPHSHTPNTDGFEPMWSTDVTVRGCRVDNGDDCITIKSGSSNVLVEDLYCENGDGLTIGSVWYDDVRNVTYRRVVMNRTANGPMIKGRSQGNATVSDITFEDISLHEVYLALTVDCDYETSGSVVPNIGVKAVNITFRNITGTVCKKRPNGYYGTSKKDPTFLVNAAGTFFCRPGRRCSLGLIDVSVKHADAHNKTPPVWACNNSDVTSTNVLPGLPGTCL